MRRTTLLSVVLILVLATGCARRSLDASYPGPVRAEVPEAFVYAQAPIVPVSMTLEETTDGYRRHRLVLEPRMNVVASHEIMLDYYEVIGPEPVPVVLVLPISGGDNEIANFLARRFARRGFAAVIVHRQEGFKKVDELEQMNPTFRQIVLDHMQAIDWIETRPEIDASRIGVFGVSAGAIKASLVSALDDRIGASVLALAGGDVPSLFAYSKERGLTKKRRAIMVEHGVTADELYAVLSEEFVHDPLHYADRIDAERTLLVLARFDAVVPYRNGLALREAIGNPETIVLPTGHYGAILFLPWIEGVAFRFFEERFDG